jgi:ribosomal protein S18 acetylase RimI-like enzyme
MAVDRLRAPGTRPRAPAGPAPLPAPSRNGTPARVPAREPEALVRVRPLRPADLAWTARLQREALPHGFFTRLGLRFLRAYHRTYLESPLGIAFAAEREDGAPAGFVLGAVDADAHRAWVLGHRRLRLAVLGALCLAVRPRTSSQFCRTRARHYLRAFVAGRRHARGTAARPSLPTAAAVLRHVAVVPDGRRGGVGRRLVDAFLEDAGRRGAGRARLTTLRDDAGAEQFWRALGWIPGSAVPDHDGRFHRVLELRL